MGQPSPQSSASPVSPGFLESIVALVLFAGVLAAQIFATGSKSVLTRPLWLDELMTYRLAADPDLSHAIAAVSAAVDSGPPIRLLLLRGFCAVTGGVDELHMRLFSVFSVLLAMEGAYLLARRVAKPASAFLAALAVASHSLLAQEQFDCRFYSTFVAAVIWFFLILVWTKHARRGRAYLNIALALAAALVCTLHYFGIFSLALILAADSLFDRRPVRAKIVTYLPTLAGPVALALSLPCYFSQKAAVTVPTWIAPADLRDTLAYFRDLLVGLPLLILAVAYFLSTIISPPAQSSSADDSSIAGLISLLLLPLVLWIFSILLQPVLLAKYAIGAVAGPLPLFIFFAARTNRGLVLASIALMIGIGAVNTVIVYRFNQTYTNSTSALISALRGVNNSEPFVFAHSDEFCAVNKYAPELASRSFFLNFNTPKDSDHPPTNFMIAERDVQRSASHFYPDYQLATPDDLKRITRFVLIATTSDLPIIKSLDNSLKFHRLPNNLFEARSN